MANCLYALGDYKSAQGKYQSAITLMKENEQNFGLESSQLDYVIANLRLADCYYYQNDPEHAFRQLRIIRDAEKSAAKATAPIVDQLKLVPQNDRALFVCKLADTEEMMNNWTDAAEDYGHALKRYFKANDEESLKCRIVAITQLAVALNHQGNGESSDQTFNEAMQQLKDIPERRDDRIAYVLRQRAASLWQRNDFIESIKLANLVKRFQ
jgi:tetratricopeptide (TPR) repeat protein